MAGQMKQRKMMLPTIRNSLPGKAEETASRAWARRRIRKAGIFLADLNMPKKNAFVIRSIIVQCFWASEGSPKRSESTSSMTRRTKGLMMELKYSTHSGSDVRIKVVNLVQREFRRKTTNSSVSCAEACCSSQLSVLSTFWLFDFSEICLASSASNSALRNSDK